MENNLFTDIAESKQRISRISKDRKSGDASNRVDPSQLARENYVYDVMYTFSMGEVQKVKSGSMLGSTYMEFELKTFRNVDEEVVSVWHRYKNIYSWYVELIRELEEIEHNPAIKFPMYTENWLIGDKNNGDVNCDFVQKRRLDLQNFFRSLFSEYPLMYDHPLVMGLLQLHRFTPLAKGTTIYSKPEAYYDIYATAASNGTGKSTTSGGAGSLDENSKPTSFQPTNAANEAYQRIAPNVASNNNKGMSIASFITDGSGNSNTLYNRGGGRSEPSPPPVSSTVWSDKVGRLPDEPRRDPAPAANEWAV